MRNAAERHQVRDWLAAGATAALGAIHDHEAVVVAPARWGAARHGTARNRRFRRQSPDEYASLAELLSALAAPGLLRWSVAATARPGRRRGRAAQPCWRHPGCPAARHGRAAARRRTWRCRQASTTSSFSGVSIASEEMAPPMGRPGSRRRRPDASGVDVELDVTSMQSTDISMQDMSFSSTQEPVDEDERKLQRGAGGRQAAAFCGRVSGNKGGGWIDGHGGVVDRPDLLASPNPTEDQSASPGSR